MSGEFPTSGKTPAAAGTHIAIVAARFNGQVVDRLLEGCRTKLAQLGVAADHVEVHQVPGAFELPLAAKVLARTAVEFLADAELRAAVSAEWEASRGP